MLSPSVLSPNAPERETRISVRRGTRLITRTLRRSSLASTARQYPRTAECPVCHMVGGALVKRTTNCFRYVPCTVSRSL